MWELTKSPSHTFVTMRRILTYFMAAVAAAFLWVLFVSPNTYALEASWDNNTTISYDGNSYIGPAQSQTVKSLGLKDGTQAYTFVGPTPDNSGRSTESAATVSKNKQTIGVIFFEKGVDATTAKNAKYMTAEYIGANNYKNPTSPTNVSINPANSTFKQGSSCSVTGGLGWLICPISNTLAGALDKAYDALSEFLNVKPVSNDTNSTLFRSWSYMRSFANVAFVIAFLIIIYSQLTSYGISNYGIKKLLPRLIIAALLVNLSYYICSIGVDISNILGHSVQDIFMSIRNGINVQTTQTSGSFASATGVLLSGGTALAVGGSVLVLYGVVGSIYLLLPALISGFFAVLVALVIIAGRQAMITVLVIVSPLAFVAYLLPNTEKWFEKWRSTFMTLLILFPAFSLIYGGSQLAAAAIIQNADSWNVMILGLFVQVAPLMITPMLIKLSGSTLGKLADFASSPGKKLSGMASSLFRDDLAATRKSERLARENVNRANPLRIAQRLDRNKRDRKFARDSNEAQSDTLWRERSRRYRTTDFSARSFADRKAVAETSSELYYNTHKTMAGSAIQRTDEQLRENKERLANIENIVSNAYNATDTHRGLHESAYRIDTEKSRIEQTLDRDLKNRVMANAQMLNQEMEVRVLTDEAARAKSDLDRINEELRAGRDRTAGGALANLTLRSETATREMAIANLASDSAKRIQQEQLENAIAPATVIIPAGTVLRDGTVLARDTEEIPLTVAALNAAGIDTADGRGVTRAQAIAKSAVDKRTSDQVTARAVLIESTTDAAGKISAAKSALETALATNDAVGARAAVKLLMTTGAPGKKKLEEVLLTIPAANNSDAVKGVKGDLLAGGIKGYNAAVDRWSTSTNTPLSAVRIDPSTYAGLNPEELAGQINPVLQAAYDNGALTADMANAVLTNEQASRKLSAAHRAFFTAIASGVPAPNIDV